MNELKWVGSDPDKMLYLGYLPKISIDPRIRCPRMFTEGFPAPLPPTARYGEIACMAAQKILSAVWPFRSYVELLKVGYKLSSNAPTTLFLFAELLIAEPTGEKFTVNEQTCIGDLYAANGMTLELTGDNALYEMTITQFAHDLSRRAKSNVQLHRKSFIEQLSEGLKRYQKAFE